MKIRKDSIKETSFSCPSSWSATLDDGTPCEINFRTGRLKLLVAGKISVTTDRDQFDVSSFMSLEEALQLLSKEGVESE